MTDRRQKLSTDGIMDQGKTHMSCEREERVCNLWVADVQLTLCLLYVLMTVGLKSSFILA